MSALIGKFRSARYRQLAEMAIAQKFQPEERGSGHFGLVCPECGTCIILSTTQRDNADYKYLNQVAYLRRHGLKMSGKKAKGCIEMRGKRDDLETLKEGGVFVVMKLSTTHADKVIAVVTSLDSASAAVVDDGDFWIGDEPVSVGDRDLWSAVHRWDDENRIWDRERFQKGQGEMRFMWQEEETEYRVQWTDISLRFA